MKVALFSILLLMASINLLAQKSGTFKDPRDGHMYKTVYIGNQIWLAENLDFDTIRSWCENCKVNGRIYQYLGGQAAVPEGWHIPTVAEWNELFNYLGGQEKAISQLTLSYNSDQKDKIGFNPKPAPYRGDDQKIHEDAHKVTYASSTVIADAKMYWTFEMDCNNKVITQLGRQWTYGVSVRCVKDYNEKYMPINSKKAKQFLDKIDPYFTNSAVLGNIQILGGMYNNLVSTNSEINLDSIKPIYGTALAIDSSNRIEISKMKEVDTSINLLKKYDALYLCEKKLLMNFYKYFYEYSLNPSNPILNEIYRNINLNAEELTTNYETLEKAKGYFRKKYKLE